MACRMGDKLPKSTRLTYVFCVVASGRQPSVRPRLKGPVGLGPVRLLPIDARSDHEAKERPAIVLWLAVADAPLAHYGAEAINRRLGDLDWVATAAVAHERVVESFRAAEGILPLKLFTIFETDRRALDDVRRRRSSIDGLFGRVIGHDEWGIRVMRDRLVRSARPASNHVEAGGGAGYLAAKKAQRDAEVGRSLSAERTMEALYDRLAGAASEAVRRSADDVPAKTSSLLLDAAFLVSRQRAKRFQTTVAREARRLSTLAYRVTLSGPWPPYSFMQES